MRRCLRRRRNVDDDQRTTHSNVADLPDLPVQTISNAKSRRRLKKKPYAYLAEWEIVQVESIPPPPELPQPSQPSDIPIIDEPLAISTAPIAAQYDQTTPELSQDIQPIPTLKVNSGSSDIKMVIPPDPPYQTQSVAPATTTIYSPTSVQYVQPASTPPVEASDTNCSGHSSLASEEKSDKTISPSKCGCQISAYLIMVIICALQEREKRCVAVQTPELPQSSQSSDTLISDEPHAIANTPITTSKANDQTTHEPPQDIQRILTPTNNSTANGIVTTIPPDTPYQTQSVAPVEPLSYIQRSQSYVRAGSTSSKETSYCSYSGHSSLSAEQILESSTEFQPATVANADECKMEPREALGAVQPPELKSGEGLPMANALITKLMPYDQDPPQYTPPTPALKDNANVNEITATVPLYMSYETQPVAPVASLGSTPTSSPNVQAWSAPPEKSPQPSYSGHSSLANAPLAKATETNSMEEEMDSQASSLYCMTMSGYQAQERRRVASKLTQLESHKRPEEEIESQTPLTEVQPATPANTNKTVSIRSEQSLKSEERRVAPSEVHPPKLPQSLQSPGVPITDEPLTTPTTPSTAPHDQETPQDTTSTPTLTDNHSTSEVTTTIPSGTPSQIQPVPPLATQNFTTMSGPNCPDIVMQLRSQGIHITPPKGCPRKGFPGAAAEIPGTTQVQTPVATGMLIRTFARPASTALTTARARVIVDK
ncbi:hypothetical protein BD410DRAFT_841116 [Rickenella mellea]|uniref:Uncharacterized protein n=1 Tax=Rickenella mellea TaxID=50990 RepID=A0A4Y7PZ66_9AGAM|nr:hypothetical protein BD410DRAFT_841116 [Rickenella mellea]